MSVIDSAVNWAVGIARDNTHGYDQIGRWGPDYDCSSLVISAYEQAGVPVKEAGASYTGNMRAAFVKCGFNALAYVKGMTLYRGDVLLCHKEINKKTYGHTCLYIGDGQIVQASCNEKGGIYNGVDGDQTGREIATCRFYEYSKGWDYVLRYQEKEEDITVNVELRQIQLGSQCPEVGTAQTLLNALGYLGKNGKVLTVDHQFGQNVEYSVKNFQKAHGIGQDGVVGSKTWTALLKADY